MLVAQPRRHPGRLRRPVRRPAEPRSRTARSTATVLTCAAADTRYDVRLAGRPSSEDDEPARRRAAAARARRAGRSPVPHGARRCMTGLGALRRLVVAARRSRRRPPRPRSAASSALSTSASGTATSPTSPTTGCCASAAPATCSSPRRRARAAAATAGSARRSAGSSDLSLDDAQWDALRIPVDLVFFFRQTLVAVRQPSLLAFYPGPGRSHRVPAGPRRLGATSPRPTPSSTTVERRRGGDPAAPARRTASPATSCRSTSATSWSATVRLHWTGLGGGAEVWRDDRRVLRRSRPARASRRPAIGIRGGAGMMPGPTAPRRRATPVVDLDFTCDEVVADRTPPARPSCSRCGRTETSGARVHALALRCQVRVEPVRRSYCDAEAAKVVDLFGERAALGPDDAADAARVPVPGAAGVHRRARRSTCPCRVSYDIDVAAHKYLAGLEDGEVPLLLLFSGTVFTGSPGRSRSCPCPGTRRPRSGCRSPVWREAMDAHFPRPGLAPARPRRLRPAGAYRGRHGLVGWDDTLTAAAREEDGDRPSEASARASRTPCSTRATCSTPTAPARRRTRCAGSGAC